MTAKTTKLSDAFLAHLFLGTPMPYSAGGLHVALFARDPGESGAVVDEVAGGGYARVRVDPSCFGPPGPGITGEDRQIVNVRDIVFPRPTANWNESGGAAQPIPYFGICSAATGGDVLYRGPITNPRAVQNGDGEPTFLAGSLAVREG